MTFHYSYEERFLVDREFRTKVKAEQRRQIASFILRIALVPITLYLLYSIDITPSEDGKLVGLLMLSIIGLMLPIFLVKIILVTILFVLKPIIYITNCVIKIINKVTKSELPTDNGNILANEDEIKLLILFSYILICTGLLLFTFFEIKNENYRTIIATSVSILYGSAISKFLEPLLLIAGFDLEIIKNEKNKDDK